MLARNADLARLAEFRLVHGVLELLLAPLELRDVGIDGHRAALGRPLFGHPHPGRMVAILRRSFRV